MIIGIAGLARVGKDTLADYLARVHDFDKYSFARPIKQAVQVMFGLDDRHTDGELKEVTLSELGKSPRELMQTLGTDWARDMVHQDAWLISAQMRIKQEDTGHVVFSDVRFENEAAWIRGLGGVVIHMRRSFAMSVRAHVSEAGVALANGDFQFDNDGPLQALFARGDALVRSLG